MNLGLNLDLGGKAASSGPTVAELLAEMIAHPAVISVWNLTDDSTDSISQERESLDQVEADGLFGQIFCQKDSIDLKSSIDGTRPTYTNGGVWATKNMDGSFPDGPLDYGCLYRGTAGGSFLTAVDGSPVVLVATSGGGGTFTSTAYVDGVVVSPSTRGELFARACDDYVHLVEARGFALTAELLRMAPLGGNYIPLWVLNPGHADIAAAREIAAAYAAKVSQELGLGN